MANANFKPLKTANSRVFYIEGRARPGRIAQYASQLKMTGLSQSFGDITKIEIPDPNNYGGFIEADRVRGASDRATASLVGRYAAAIKSKLLQLSSKGCPVDVQLHIGECSDPSSFNVFSKNLILEDVVISSYSTEDLGAIQADENAKVDETADISASKAYEVTPLSFAKRADDLVLNQVMDVVIAEYQSCGSCSSQSDGCQRIFAVTVFSGGSPATIPDIIFSLDGGATWKAHDIDSFTSEAASGVAQIGDYIVVPTNTSASMSIALVSDFVSGVDPAFSKISTGFITAGKPTHVCSVGRKAFLSATAGYVYFTEDPTAGVIVLDAGIATVDQLNCIHALDEYRAVAVGNNGSVIYTRNRTSWDVTAARPVGAAINLTSVFMKNDDLWFVTASNGKVYYTDNRGGSWNLITTPGTAPTTLSDITFATDSVGYLSGTVSAKGRLYRTFDGGQSWVVCPESVGTFPSCTALGAVAACSYNPDFVVTVGTATGGTDGIIVVGTGS